MLPALSRPSDTPTRALVELSFRVAESGDGGVATVATGSPQPRHRAGARHNKAKPILYSSNTFTFHKSSTDFVLFFQAIGKVASGQWLRKIALYLRPAIDYDRVLDLLKSCCGLRELAIHECPDEKTLHAVQSKLNGLRLHSLSLSGIPTDPDALAQFLSQYRDTLRNLHLYNIAPYGSGYGEVLMTLSRINGLRLHSLILSGIQTDPDDLVQFLSQSRDTLRNLHLYNIELNGSGYGEVLRALSRINGPRLHSLSLCGIQSDPDDLIQFLSQYKDTLRNLHLQNIELNGSGYGGVLITLSRIRSTLSLEQAQLEGCFSCGKEEYVASSEGMNNAVKRKIRFQKDQGQIPSSRARLTKLFVKPQLEAYICGKVAFPDMNAAGPVFLEHSGKFLQELKKNCVIVFEGYSGAEECKHDDELHKLLGDVRDELWRPVDCWILPDD